MRPVSPLSVVPPPPAVSAKPSTTTVTAGMSRPRPGAQAPAERACQAPAQVPSAPPRKLEMITSPGGSSSCERGSNTRPSSPKTIRTSAQTSAAAPAARSPVRAVMPASVGGRVVVRREVEIVLVRVPEPVAPEQDAAHDEDDHEHHEGDERKDEHTGHAREAYYSLDLQRVDHGLDTLRVPVLGGRAQEPVELDAVARLHVEVDDPDLGD